MLGEAYMPARGRLLNISAASMAYVIFWVGYHHCNGNIFIVQSELWRRAFGVLHVFFPNSGGNGVAARVNKIGSNPRLQLSNSTIWHNSLQNRTQLAPFNGAATVYNLTQSNTTNCPTVNSSCGASGHSPKLATFNLSDGLTITGTVNPVYNQNNQNAGSRKSGRLQPNFGGLGVGLNNGPSNSDQYRW